MSSLEHEGGAEFPYRHEDVFRAIVVGVDNLPGMRVESEDPSSGRILIKTGVTGGRTEEKFPITVVQLEPGRTRIDIASAPRDKASASGDPEKNRATVDKILRATSEALKAFGGTEGR